MNTILYAFVCRHMVYYFVLVGGFQDLALRSKLLIHPLYIAARCVVVYLSVGFLCTHNLIIFTYTLYRVILSLEAPNKFGKSIPEFGETHSSVLGCERRPVSA